MNVNFNIQRKDVIIPKLGGSNPMHYGTFGRTEEAINEDVKKVLRHLYWINKPSFTDKELIKFINTFYAPKINKKSKIRKIINDLEIITIIRPKTKTPSNFRNKKTTDYFRDDIHHMEERHIDIAELMLFLYDFETEEFIDLIEMFEEEDIDVLHSFYYVSPMENFQKFIKKNPNLNDAIILWMEMNWK